MDFAASTAFGPGCLKAAETHVRVCTRLFSPPRLPPPDGRALRRWSWWFAGLAVLADWIGSNQTWFPYHPPELEPEEYLERLARPRAADALARAGILPAPVSAATGFRAVTGLAVAPSPLQRWAERVELPDGPLLFLIEEVAGSGKTEAALVLAHRLMASGRARGLHVALPTMATANAMYARLAAGYRRLFAPDAAPSLALAHSSARFHAGFRASILRDAEENEAVSGILDEDFAERTGDLSAAACAGWLAEGGRKAFLADIGVGTIDQALLAALPVRYQSLRLFGLADHVLVVDEAHAYDTYMGVELEGLLRFQAALGGHAIVLSATLPGSRRRQLVRAFLGDTHAEPVAATDRYPLVTLAHSRGISETPLPTRADMSRRLRVDRLATVAEVVARIREAAERGAAVAWIRNAVDDAIEAVAELRARGVEATLFHARFTLGDRLEIERRILARFGRDGPSENRPGVLVATQVVEQSLDLDFDLMVSDLAPIDLLLQRAGRLWRHRRPSRPLPHPTLAVHGPEAGDTPAADWYAAPFPRAAYVYRNHGILWLTARTLFSRRQWRIPEDVRELIESVYGDADPRVPAALERNWITATGEERAAGWMAEVNLLRPEQGYDGQRELWDSEERFPTRLGDPTRTLRLARLEQGEIVPFHAADDRQLAWSLSEVRLRAGWAKDTPIPPELEGQADRIRRQWHHSDEDKLLVIMRSGEDGTWLGEVLDEKDRKLQVLYRSDYGLKLRAPNVS